MTGTNENRRKMRSTVAVLAAATLILALTACADSELERLSQLRAESARAAAAKADALDTRCAAGDGHACDEAVYYRSAASSQASLAEQEHRDAVAQGQQRAATAMAVIGAAAVAGAAASAANRPAPGYVVPAAPVYVVPAAPTHCTSFMVGSFLNTSCY